MGTSFIRIAILSEGGFESSSDSLSPYHMDLHISSSEDWRVDTGLQKFLDWVWLRLQWVEIVSPCRASRTKGQAERSQNQIPHLVYKERDGVSLLIFFNAEGIDINRILETISLDGGGRVLLKLTRAPQTENAASRRLQELKSSTGLKTLYRLATPPGNEPTSPTTLSNTTRESRWLRAAGRQVIRTGCCQCWRRV